jgi:hypothetical protein
VGSNHPTLSTSFVLVKFGIGMSSFWFTGGQKPSINIVAATALWSKKLHQCSTPSVTLEKEGLI